MADIIRFVEELIKGYAYESEGDVYFEGKVSQLCQISQ